MSVTRKRFTREFKLQVIRAYESGTTVSELTRQFDIHPNLVYKSPRSQHLVGNGRYRSSASNYRRY